MRSVCPVGVAFAVSWSTVDSQSTSMAWTQASAQAAARTLSGGGSGCAGSPAEDGELPAVRAAHRAPRPHAATAHLQLLHLVEV